MAPNGAAKARHAASARPAGLPAAGMKPCGVDSGHLHRREIADEGRIELMIVAGELVALGNIDQGVAFVEDAEVRVWREAVIHEAPVVAVDNHESRNFQMRVAVARDEVLQM